MHNDATQAAATNPYATQRQTERRKRARNTPERRSVVLQSDLAAVLSARPCTATLLTDAQLTALVTR